IRLARQGVGSDAFAALDRGEREAALDGLLAEMSGADATTGELLRQAIIGVLSELDPADPGARAYRRQLATALG
ncbi:MAG: tetratricopeptide repeat protein, partial [Solirubrobacterales bacterium]